MFVCMPDMEAKNDLPAREIRLTSLRWPMPLCPPPSFPIDDLILHLFV